jgi:uncharacterized protein (DUF1499 family)
MYPQPAARMTLAITLALSAACSTLPLPAPPANPMPIDPRLSCTLPTNCVNSRTSSGLAPLGFAGSGAHALALLQATLASFPEATIQQQDERAMTAVFTTPAGFRDHVIFLLNLQQQEIDYQSHSGFGFYDFGKNRARMLALTARFAEVTAAAHAK